MPQAASPSGGAVIFVLILPPPLKGGREASPCTRAVVFGEFGLDIYLCMFYTKDEDAPERSFPTK